MDEFMKGTTYSYADEVARGVKPVAEMTVKTERAMECVSFVHKHHPEVTCLVEECDTSPGWSFVWMMKDARMYDVIVQRPVEPKTVADHWYLGKLFGYSDTDILDWVDENERVGASTK